jgi:uncharacterized phage protein gp47/JayE
MAYFAPFIDDAGLHIPTYQNIEDKLVENAQLIFGDDIYLENDSQDFQDIAARARAIYETLLTTQMAYNARSPITATGASLDAVVELCGIRRHGASFSTAEVTITGTAFTLITNGVVADINGNLWSLPTTVTIEVDGTVVATATCQQEGEITALPDQIAIIQTPTFGWASVTNPAAATVGQPTETDSALRARQAVSVANPSQALTTGILGGVLAVDNVVDAQLYENDTSSTVYTIGGVPNIDGFPAHSISLVVDGGDDNEVAQAIALRKTPGCYTNGDVPVVVYDRYGVPITIRFFRPVEKTVFVEITIRALAGYTSAIGADIKAALLAYVNGMQAGESLILSELWEAALSVDPRIDPRQMPTFSLTSLEAYITSGAPLPDDITFQFDEKAVTELLNITLLVT